MSEPKLHLFLRHLRDRSGHGAGLADAELLERFVAQRDEAAFEVLVWRHGPLVLGAGRRLLRSVEDAEDVFQATFLVLARKAQFIARREALAGWLHRTASRLALRLRARQARRASVQCLSEDMPVPVASEPEDRELEAVLDVEVGRLPEKLRLPVVLVYLQGRTTEEAARELGWPKGTVCTRLAGARARLQRQLTRRGLAPMVAGLTAAFESAAQAAVPAALAATTARAAVAVTSGQAPTTALSAQATVLVQATIREALLARLRCALALVLLLAGLGTGLLGWAAFAAAPDNESAGGRLRGFDPGKNQQDAASLAMKELEGTWRVVSVEIGNQPAPDEPGPNNLLIFERNRCTVKVGKKEFAATFTIDPSKTPRWLDMKDDKSGIVWPGIYELKGDTLRLFLGSPGKAHPTKFSTRPDSTEVIHTCKRITGAAGAALPLGKEPVVLDVKHVPLHVAFSPDGRWLAAGDGGSVLVWEAATFRLVQELKGHQEMIMALAFSPDSRRLAASSRDLSVKVWDLGTGKEIQTFKGDKLYVAAMAFSADGRQLVCAEGHQLWLAMPNKAAVKVWEVATGRLVRSLDIPVYAADHMALSRDGKYLAGIDPDGVTRVRDLTTGREIAGFVDVPDGGTVNGVPTAKPKDRQVYRKATGVAFSPDGMDLATCNEGGDLVLWSLSCKQVLTSRRNPTKTSLHVIAGAGQLYFNTNGKRIAVALTEHYEQPDGRVKQRHQLLVWDLTRRTKPLSLPGKGPVVGVAFHPDGERVAVAFTLGSVQIQRPWPKVKK
jgi:RNA polymerase sigma-70 factor (ECF subfamily)